MKTKSSLKIMKTKHEAPRSVNYRARQNKNNIGTTVLERPVEYTTGGGGGSKDLSLYRLHPGSLINTHTFIIIIIVMLIIISLFQEDNIFGTNASLTYDPRLQR